MSKFIQELHDKVDEVFNKIFNLYLTHYTYLYRDTDIYKTIYRYDSNFLTLLRDYAFRKASDTQTRYYVDMNDNGELIVYKYPSIKSTDFEVSLEDTHKNDEVCGELACYIDYILKAKNGENTFTDGKLNLNFDMSFIFMESLVEMFSSILTLCNDEYNRLSGAFDQDNIFDFIISHLSLDDLKTFSLYISMRQDLEDDEDYKRVIGMVNTIVKNKINAIIEKEKKEKESHKRGVRLPFTVLGNREVK